MSRIPSASQGAERGNGGTRRFGLRLRLRIAHLQQIAAGVLIGGTVGGTILTLVFLPALYAIWFKIKPAARDGQVIQVEPVAG